MLSFYLGCLAFGGVLLVASMFGGHGDHGADHGGGDHDHGHGDGHHHGSGTSLLPLLSLRFWTFALAFFGLSGAVLTGVGAGAALTAVASGGFGLGAGYGAARLLQALAHRPVGLIAGAQAHIGREGKLLLPVDRQQRGKIRISVGGLASDLLAETEGDEPLPAGATAIIVGMRGNVALVERSPSAPLLPEANEKENA